MALFNVHVYRAHPGRGFDMLGQMAKAKTVLEAHGATVTIWQALIGGEGGSISFVDSYVGAGSYGRAMDAVNKDPAWLELFQEIVTAPSGDNVDNYRLTDVDPLAVLPTAPSTVIHQILHRPRTGRTLDLMKTSGTALGHFTRLGAQARFLQVTGRVGAAYSTLVGFEDYTHYGDFAEKLAADEQWATFWGGVLADPPAEELESAIASLIEIP